MPKPVPPHDPIETLGEAYETLLEKSIEEAHKTKAKSGPALHRLIDEVAQKSSDVTELAGEEAMKIGEYLKRDLVDAANYLDKTGKELTDWLGFDLGLLKTRLREDFSQAADQTTIELLRLKQAAQAAGYQTGEVCGPGTLTCDKCGEKLHFHRAGHIPPCPRCKGAHFHRNPD